MAQGSKLTQTQVDAVTESLTVTPSWRAAADHAGINERTIHRYRERSDAYANRHETSDEIANLPDKTDPDYLPWSVVQTWTEARSQLEHSLVRGVLAAIPKDWKAAHALLKSGWPQDYSDRVELTGAGGGPIQLEQLRSEALQRAEDALAELGLRALGDESADRPSAGNDE